jgi:16S rRNA G527 N7-methylase RsmG
MTELQELTESEFSRRLARFWPQELSADLSQKLFVHYEELRRWAGTMALIGPGAASEIFERHYAESLRALPWLPRAAAGPGGRLLDLGSGAGFPGWILAAARPDLEVTLVEARERKWAFLTTAARRARLSCRCLNARVSARSLADLPDRSERIDLQGPIDVVTVRALRLEAKTWAALLPHLGPGAQVLLWSGEIVEPPPPPFVAGRTLALSGSHRFLREYRLPIGLLRTE